MNRQIEAEINNVARLKGGTVKNAVTSNNGESWGLVVEVDGKTSHAWVDCDPEGNGPGHIDIEEV